MFRELIADPAPTTRPARRVARLSGEAGVDRLRGRLHLLALIAAPPAALALVVHASSARARWSAVVYAITLVGLYAVSVAYHVPRWRASTRAALRLADRSMIYAFIAGCYTPLCVVVIGGDLGAVIAALAWLLAGAGVFLTMTRLGRARVLCGLLYIAQGWLVMAVLPVIASRLDPEQLVLLFGGGGVFTLGAAVLAGRRPDPLPGWFGYHEVWHAMVVVGTAFHFALLWQLL
jgi:hemolysin III